jgi:ABC-type tungstate transport system permease subunit
MFEEDNPYSVKVIAVSSGQAMEMGREGEAFTPIADSGSTFIYLGEDSGTHIKELSIMIVLE